MHKDPCAGTAAVLFATPRPAADVPVPHDVPAALLPVGHATLVERLVEQLARLGLAEVHVVACDRPELLREVLGEGERWGIRLRWRLVKDPERPYGALSAIGLERSSRVLIGHTDRWVEPAALARMAKGDALFVELDATHGFRWTGWAGVPGRMLGASLRHCDRHGLHDELRRAGLAPIVADGARSWPVLDAAGLLEAQRAVIAGQADAPLPPEWIPRPWGAASPAAFVHPAARIVGPTLIGPGCLVAAGASLGPGAVLTRDVVVGANTTVRSSVILPRTYLGPGLDVHDSIANGGRLRHVRLEVETSLSPRDGLALSLDARPGPRPTAGARLIAAVAATVLLPGLALAVLARRSHEPALPWYAQQAVTGMDPTTRQVKVGPLRCPRTSGSVLRRSFGFYGALLDVVQGRRCWFGVRPRRRGEWYGLSAEWQSLLAGAPIGILTAPAWTGDEGARAEASAAADAFFLVRKGWRENLRIAWAAVRPAG